MSRGQYTRWAVIASGEGGGRIASQFFNRAENPGIEDRILVMNTNRNDIRNTVDRIDAAITEDADIENTHALEFGEIAVAHKHSDCRAGRAKPYAIVTHTARCT